MIGAWGRNLADSVFMAAPTTEQRQNGVEAPILMEFFPSGTFVRDQEYAVRAAGLRYMAWWDSRYARRTGLPPTSFDHHTNAHDRDRKFTAPLLPQVMGVREGQNPYLSIDVSLVLQEIRQEARRLES